MSFSAPELNPQRTWVSPKRHSSLTSRSTGATKVHIFDHTLRGRRDDSSAKTIKPVSSVHIDQAFTSAPHRAAYELGPEIAVALTQKRYQVLNVWRPLGTVTNDPLAVADTRSIPNADLVAIPVVYPDTPAVETYSLRASGTDQHEWWYCDGMRSDEVLVFKTFESEGREGRARFCAHSSFTHPDFAHAERARESVEVRALVFYE